MGKIGLRINFALTGKYRAEMKVIERSIGIDRKAKLDRRFYRRSTPRVARDLLGKILVRVYDGNILAGKIVETEAYCGESDPASHAAAGRTERTEIMFGPPGYAYIYLIYGKYYCLNAVTETEGKAGAVLIRALEPLQGIKIMQRFRPSGNLKELTSGPGKLCQALAIDHQLNGADLLGNTLFLLSAPPIPEKMVAATPRIGVSAARNVPWRFIVNGNPFVTQNKK